MGFSLLIVIVGVPLPKTSLSPSLPPRPPSLGRLTETAEGLQSQVDELQRELEALKSVTRPSRRTPPPGDTRSTHSVSCLTELQSTLR